MSPSELFLKIASLPVVLAAVFVYAVVTALFFKFNPKNAIEERFKQALNQDLFFRQNLSFYGPRRFYAMLDAYTEADYRDEYKSLFMDIFYPLIYGSAFALVIVYLQNQFRPPDATLSPYPVLIPLAQAFFDYLENISQYLLLRRHQASRQRVNALVRFSATMTALKLLLWAASVLIIIAGVVKLAFE